MFATADRLDGDLPVTDAADAAERIDADETVLVSGFGSVGYPKAVPRALARSDRERELTVVSSGSVGAEIDDDLIETGAIARRYPYQAQSESRAAANDGSLAFHDRHVSRTGDEVELGHFGRPETAVVEAVAVGEDWLVPTTSIGHTPAYVRAADRLIVEVNEAQPLALQRLHDVYRRALPPDREPLPLTSPGGRIGSPKVGFDPDALDAVVRTDAPDRPYEFRDPTDADAAIAENLAGFLSEEVERNPVLEDRIALQFGVGSLGNALMGEFDAVDFGDRDVVYYGEVIQDGLLDMLDSGNLRSASATSLALSADGVERLHDAVERYAERVVLRNADVSNDPALIDRFGVVAVNSALEVDLYGHVNSTHIDGVELVNGVGGSGDFSRNSLIGVIALASTAGGGEISRVVPMAPHVDHTEHDVSVIVTEQGVADLRGLDPRERAEALVGNCAHPRFRDELRRYLDRAATGGGHLPHDLDSAFDWST